MAIWAKRLLLLLRHHHQSSKKKRNLRTTTFLLFVGFSVLFLLLLCRRRRRRRDVFGAKIDVVVVAASKFSVLVRVHLLHHHPSPFQGQILQRPVVVSLPLSFLTILHHRRRRVVVGVADECPYY